MLHGSEYVDDGLRMVDRPFVGRQTTIPPGTGTAPGPGTRPGTEAGPDNPPPQTDTDEDDRRDEILDIYRGLFDKRGQPQVNPGAFRYDSDGVSMFELPYLGETHPWALGFVVALSAPKTPGATGPLVSPPGCLATFTPAFQPGHWSVDCGGEAATKSLLSTYGKLARDLGAIMRNPSYGGE